ncbi:MAG: lipopolysaccharide/colanic/teichoic acid biosynthesis glycosyltransferase [Polaribacter sp.]|jgi:lipopolysaccharide/colanic/teichoic acid biosynthesis glycosyltransferase
MKRISTQTLQGVQDVLVLGFDSHSYILLNEQEGVGYYDFKTYSNSFLAYTHLEGTFVQKPVAIICNYEFLREENFRFLHSLTAHESHKNIPFIVISSDGLDIPVEQALKMGIDDCYTEPVNWRNLKKRVVFLQQYKEELLKPTDNPVDNTYHYKTTFGKRVFDCVVALTIMLVFSPILLFIILAIKVTSDGPVIYRSKRIGQGYNAFYFFKFRSMCIDADDKRKELSYMSAQAGAFLKIKNDPRVTKIGWLIRKTSLDELPQLLNVLRGEMSIIGNRPLPLTEAEMITKDVWAARFLAPAGITGLWQTAPGGKENMRQEERIGLDIEYATRLSAIMDAKILLRTIPAMIQKGE